MRKVLSLCPTCGQGRMLRPSDAKRAKQCRTCHLRGIAPLGYKATAEKYGQHFAVEVQRTYRLENPSDLERQLMAVLEELELPYEREVMVEAEGRAYLIDFVLFGDRAVEVNGEWVHQFHGERDARKLRALRNLGYDVMVVNETDLQNGIRSHLLAFTGLA